MIDFLITIILVLILVLVAIVHLFRLIFRFSHPYASAVIAPRPATTHPNANRGSAVGIFILILVGALAYLSLNNRNISPPSLEPDRKIEQVTSSPDTPRMEEPMNSEESTEPQSRSPGREFENDTGFPETENFRKIQTNEWEVDRYNQSPKRSLPARFYSIQLNAFNDRENAEREANRLGSVYKNLKLIYVEGFAPFKVILGPFNDEEAAKTFKKRHKTGGFISLIDHQ